MNNTVGEESAFQYVQIVIHGDMVHFYSSPPKKKNGFLNNRVNGLDAKKICGNNFP